MTPKIRINLELSPEIKRKLDNIQKKTEAATMADVIRKSVTLLDIVTEAINSGGKVIIETKDGKQETLRLL